MDFAQKIRELMRENGNITEYRLAKDSQIPASTLANILHRDTAPTMFTLQEICRFFHLTLSQFFFDPETETRYPLTESQRRMVDKWAALTPEQQRILMELIEYMQKQNDEA